jgi:hypothetical protein
MQTSVQQMMEKDRCEPQAAARMRVPSPTPWRRPRVGDQPRCYEALHRPSLSLGETTALIQIGV